MRKFAANSLPFCDGRVVGLSEEVFSRTVTYLKERKQFGKAIGNSRRCSIAPPSSISTSRLRAPPC